MKNTVVVSFAAIAFFLSGCQKDDAEGAPFPEGLKTVWAEMFAPYGLYPLFPVRTGVQPGDVAVLCKRPKTIEAIVAASAASSVGGSKAVEEVSDKYEWQFLFSLSGISEALSDHSKSRMRYHTFATPINASASAPLGAVSSPTTGTSPFQVSTPVSSVGFASFPSVLSYIDKRSDFGVGTAAGVAAVGAGTSRRAFNTYILEIPAAEYAGLPHALLQRAVIATASSATTDVRESLKRVSEAFIEGTCLTGTLSVVGEVFYARNITVSMADSYSNALSARAAYQLPANSTRAAVFSAIGAYATGASAPSPSTSSGIPSDGARLAKLMLDIDNVYKAADDNSKLGFTGVRFGFAQSSGKGISMDYRYAAPVAFGVRLYSIELGSDTTSPGLKSSLPLVGSITPTKTIGQALEGELRGAPPSEK